MKKMFLGICLFATALFTKGQTTTSITVTDEKGIAVGNVTIEIEKIGVLIGDEHGKASFKTSFSGRFSCRISSIGFNTLSTVILLKPT
jgi:hypothetical protein